MLHNYNNCTMQQQIIHAFLINLLINLIKEFNILGEFIIFKS